ncbi:hypothetical protein LOK74_00830 [Brevibacillus humidisoli]|uniref:hypothetical protein n=1 Tax=Brevibacillus humidisoli TaxID=2895522 RepID=UPI001E5706DB|nr:hypothetical protein [Brevibacillus humidisoli]UFJ41139.1 hypothetical protein LOK74_00830 [Brevibacillus humidisoli]
MERMTSVGAMFLLLLTSLALGIISLSQAEQYVLAGSILAMGLLFLLLHRMHGFTLLIVYVMGLVGYTLWVSFDRDIQLGLQGALIWRQTVWTLAVAAVWLFVYSIKQQREELKQLRRQVAELQKVEPSTGVLTFNEFMEKAKLLFTGVKRRGEQGFCLLIQIVGEQDGKPYKQPVLYEKVVAILLRTVRQDYDLVGKLACDRLVVFLTNTNRKGVESVLERFEQKVVQEPNLDMWMLQVRIQQIAEDWTTFERETTAFAEEISA